MRKLSPREIEVLRHVAEGMSAKETGRVLGITESTVKVHRKTVFRMIGAKNAPHAVSIGIRKGIIPTEEAA